MRLIERGVTEEEVRIAVNGSIASGAATPNKAGGDRFEVERVFEFNAVWQGTFYPRKLIRVVFVYIEREDAAIGVTVISRFGRYDL